MTIFQLIFISVGLGCDAFAVALAISTKGATKRQAFRLSFHFGLFQFLMPILGWYFSRSFADYLGKSASILAFLLLAVISIKMFYESMQSDEESLESKDRTKGWSLVSLSFATSQDALGTGITLGMMNCKLFETAILIGITAMLMTLAGVLLGVRLSTVYGKVVEKIGAIILMIIAISLLLQ